MAAVAREPGVVARRVAANVRAIRFLGNLSTATLSRRLAEIGHPIHATGITKIEKGTRRVDVDDLAALAQALGVEPEVLLYGEIAILGKRGERQ